MKLFIILALAVCVKAADIQDKGKESKVDEPQVKDKRQTQDDVVPGHYIYRAPRKQEQVAPVQENQDDDKLRENEEYRPGQVFSLNAQELLELQPERKAPLGSDQLLQQLYVPSQQEHKQNLQQVYYLEPQVSRQVALQPSHAVIARPHYSANGGEASVGAALSVSDTGASPESSPFDQDLLALLQVRPDEQRQAYPQPQPIQQTASPNLQHQQIDRYITKPIKKPTKLRNKVVNPTPTAAAPQQYLIETTNVQQQQQLQQQQHLQQQQALQQYRTAQPQRPLQSLRYVPIQQAQPALQQVVYQSPEPQGLKVVPAPKLQPLPQQQQQQPRAQYTYRILPQYQPQQEATPKQYRILESPRPQPIRQEQRLSSVERPVTYLKRYPEPEKMRAVKIYEQVDLPSPPQPAQVIGEQYFLRPIYRQSEQRARYELPVPLRPVEQSRPIEATKAPSSAIYVSKNLTPKKLRPQIRPEQSVKIEQPSLEQQQQALDIDQHSQSIEEQRARLPPPRNNKAYTPEEFAALVAAGYSVTPVPVSALNPHVAQSRSSIEAAPAQLKRRPIYRRPQYLPIRDDAP